MIWNDKVRLNLSLLSNKFDNLLYLESGSKTPVFSISHQKVNRILFLGDNLGIDGHGLTQSDLEEALVNVVRQTSQKLKEESGDEGYVVKHIS